MGIERDPVDQPEEVDRNEKQNMDQKNPPFVMPFPDEEMEHNVKLDAINEFVAQPNNPYMPPYYPQQLMYKIQEKDHANYHGQSVTNMLNYMKDMEYQSKLHAQEYGQMYIDPEELPHPGLLPPLQAPELPADTDDDRSSVSQPNEEDPFDLQGILNAAEQDPFAGLDLQEQSGDEFDDDMINDLGDMGGFGFGGPGPSSGRLSPASPTRSGQRAPPSSPTYGGSTSRRHPISGYSGQSFTVSSAIAMLQDLPQDSDSGGGSPHLSQSFINPNDSRQSYPDISGGSPRRPQSSSSSSQGDWDGLPLTSSPYGSGPSQRPIHPIRHWFLSQKYNTPQNPPQLPPNLRPRFRPQTQRGRGRGRGGRRRGGRRRRSRSRSRSGRRPKNQ